MNESDKRRIQKALEALDRADIESATALLRSLISVRQSRVVNHRTKMPSVWQIVNAQKFLIDRLSVSDPLCECWCCGSWAKLTRCHIKAVRNGGGEEPRNFFLLCEGCHGKQPDGETYEAQVEWLIAGNREADFHRLTGHTLEELANFLFEIHGSHEVSQALIRKALQAGSDRSASKKISNQLANQAFALRDLWDEADRSKPKKPA